MRSVPLVVDCSSCILSEPMEISRYGLIFMGGAEKYGDRRSDSCDRAGRSDSGASEIPSMLSYAVQAKNKSMFNTPPTFAIYLLGLVLEWIENRYHDLAWR